MSRQFNQQSTPPSTPLATPLGHANPQDLNAWKETDLRMHIIPLEAQCGACHQVFHVEKFHFQCPECESPELTILQGEDLILESVTLEDGNPNN
jgi:hypothetical protein